MKIDIYSDRVLLWFISVLSIGIILTVIFVMAALDRRSDNKQACADAGGMYVRVTAGDYKCLDVKEIPLD